MKCQAVKADKERETLQRLAHALLPRELFPVLEHACLDAGVLALALGHWGFAARSLRLLCERLLTSRVALGSLALGRVKLSHEPRLSLRFARRILE